MELTTQKNTLTRDNWLNVADYYRLIDYQSLLEHPARKGTSDILRSKFLEEKYDLSASVIRNASVSTLLRLNRTVDLSFERRALSKMLSHKFTALGIAPAYRGIQLPRDFTNRDLKASDTVLAFDQCMSDLYWLHKKHREHGRIRAEAKFNLLMGADKFDFKLANRLIMEAHDDCAEPSSLFVHRDIQWELVVYRSQAIEEVTRHLTDETLTVKNDLILAANRNRRRGNKLLSRLPDRLAVWQAAKLGQGATMMARNQIYRKMTGAKIAPSTYSEKLSSTNAALSEVGSEHVIP